MLDPNEYKGIKKYEGHGKDLIVPGSGYRYMGDDPNIYSNAVVKMVEYHIDTLPIFQDIIDTSWLKVKYGGWMSVQMNEGERLVICMGQDEAIWFFSRRRCVNTMESVCSLIP